MNSERRAVIKDAAKGLAEAGAIISENRALIEQTKDEEQEALDSLAENFKNGDRGQEMQASIAAFDDALDQLDRIDLAKVGQSLAEAIDRDVADLPEATLDEETADARRWERLAPWARTEIERLRAELASVREQAREVYGDPDPDKFIIGDYLSPHDGRSLPFTRLTLRDITISIERQKGITLLSNAGSLLVMPNVSNQITVLVDRRQ